MIMANKIKKYGDATFQKDSSDMIELAGTS